MTNTEVIREDVARTVDMIRFLRATHTAVDRVLMIDAHDTYVNRDPFEVLTARNLMTFFGEGTPLSAGFIDMECMRTCSGMGAFTRSRTAKRSARGQYTGIANGS
jgi:hypothetical protein